MAKIVIQTENGEHVHELSSNAVTIGRFQDNKIAISDGSVSGHHAEIVACAGVFVLRDLNSSNGTHVKNQTVSEIQLIDGDVIRFGAIQATFFGNPTEVIPSELKDTSSNDGDRQTSISECRPEYQGIGASVLSIGNASFAEIKRATQLATLKATCEKIKQVDLYNAYSAIGRKAYELTFSSEQFSRYYDEIAVLENESITKRVEIRSAPDAQAAERLKNIVVSGRMKVEVEILERKLSGKFAALGQTLAGCGPFDELKIEFTNLQFNLSKIERIDNDYTTLSENRLARQQISHHFFSLVSKVVATGSSVWVAGMDIFRRQFRLTRLMLALAVSIIIIATLYTVSKQEKYRNLTTDDRVEIAKLESSLYRESLISDASSYAHGRAPKLDRHTIVNIVDSTLDESRDAFWKRTQQNHK